MNPVISIEFNASSGNINFKEESIAIHSPEELFSFVAPGGGCERIPDEVDEIQIIFSVPQHPNTKNPVADKRATLELGMVFITGTLSEIMETAEQIIDKAGRNDLSESFLKVINFER